MYRLSKEKIKQIVFIPLFIFSSGVLSQTLNFSDVLTLIDENNHVTIPSNYTEIGNSAFKYTAVVTVTIPASVTTIGARAFEHTSKLSEIVIPDSVTEIGEYAFNMSGLRSIILPDGINIGNYAFSGASLVHLKIPDNSTLGNKSFYNLSSLESLEIGKSVTSETSGYNLNFSGYGDGNSLKTLITSSTIGCNGDHNPGYLCFINSNNDLDKLEFLIINAPVEWPRDNIFGANTTVIVKSNLLGGFNRPAKEVLIVSPGTVNSFIAQAPHDICASNDSDNDGHQDCYDQFPDDPDHWFHYAYTTLDNTTTLVHSDTDGLADIFDQYPTINNVEGFSEDRDQSEFELDTDYDGINNFQDIDDDDDGLLDIYESFFGTNPLIPDSDFDGAIDGLDAFPMDNTESLDADSDGIGNNADTDDDNDGYTDFLDAFPTDASEWADSDLDGIGNNSDLDDDNDGVADTEDAFPHTASESLDSDNDGVGDNADAFPNDSTEVADTDLDGIGNNADSDDDNDGVADADDGDPLNADIGIQPSQLISVAGNPVGVNGHSARISLSYDTSDGNNQLPGIGFRLHYSSEMLSFAGTENSIANDIIVDGDGPYQDDSDYDNDSNTDKYIIFGWAALNGDWPNSSLPASLVDVVFNVSREAFDQASINTPINFSKVSATEGYNFEATNYTLNVLPATWDFDGNGQADALTDGLILLRHAFGVRGESLTDSVVATDSTMTSDEVQAAVEKALVIADVDGDGNVDALTDGLIVLRYMFGLTGDTLMDGVVSANATRASSESVQQHIELYMPNNLLPPVQSDAEFFVGDWQWKSEEFADERNRVDGELNWEVYPVDPSISPHDCMIDDIYSFDSNMSFSYEVGTGTYNFAHMSGGGWDTDGCHKNLYPFDGTNNMSFEIDDSNKTLTLLGKGAYIVWPDTANGIDEISEPSLAPDQRIYNYTILSQNEVQLYIHGYFYHIKTTLQRVVN